MGFLPSGTTVTVETKWFPPLTVDLSGKAEPSTGGKLGALVVLALKPRVTVKAAGTTIVTSTPYGNPDPNEWDRTKVVVAVVVGLAVFTVLRFFK